MNPLQELLDQADARRKADAKRFKDHDEALCMICWAYGNDKRSLFVDCFYAVHEAVPEAVDLHGVMGAVKERGYFLRVCKACRGAFLGKMREWANERRALRYTPKDHDGNIDSDNPEANIPLRVDGAIVMLTREQWEERKRRSAPQGRTE